MKENYIRMAQLFSAFGKKQCASSIAETLGESWSERREFFEGFERLKLFEGFERLQFGCLHSFLNSASCISVVVPYNALYEPAKMFAVKSIDVKAFTIGIRF